MKKEMKLLLCVLALLPVFTFAQDDLLNSIDIEGINLMGYPKWDLSLTGGLAYRFEPIPDETVSQSSDHLQSLKGSYIYGGSLYYFYKEGVGIGANFSRFSASGAMVFEDGLNPAAQPLYVKNEKLLTDYYGANFYFRQSNNSEESYFGPVVGLGYFRYHQTLTVRDDSFNKSRPEHLDFRNKLNDVEYKGGAMGLDVGLRFQRRLSEHLAVGAKLDLLIGFWGAKGFWQVRKENSVQTENLSRVEFGVTIDYLK